MGEALRRHKLRKRGEEPFPQAPVGPNKGLELTAASVRSAPAFGSSSGLALGVRSGGAIGMAISTRRPTVDDVRCSRGKGASRASG